MQDFPIDIFFYPTYRGENPYIRLLAEKIRKINPQANVYYYYHELVRYCPKVKKWNPRKKIVHIQFLPEYFHVDQDPTRYGNFLFRHIERNKPYIKVIREFLSLEKLKRRYGLKFIWTVHNRNSYHIRPTWTSFLSKYVIFRLADAFIVHCGQEAKDPDIAKTGKPIFIVPHGNYIGCFGEIVEDRAEAKLTMGIPQNVPTFLIFGKIHQAKNLKYLLSCLSKLPQQNLLFIIAGRPIKRDIYTIAKEYASDRRSLFILRHIPNEQIRWSMSAADFLINAQIRGYVSGVLMLALSYGLPEIVIKWGCAPMIVKDGINGFLFREEPGMLENAISRALYILNNPMQYRQMRLMALETVRAFSWDTVAEKTLDAYYQTLKITA
jgi:glycosyltransferase involved in cell wall biosynthesis